jgi:hypothetical protein
VNPSPSWRGDDREFSAGLILSLGLIAALLPVVMALGAVILVRLGILDWWVGYGLVLYGDASRLGLALQAAAAAVVAAAAGLAAALWAGPQRFYARAMLNLAIAGATLWILVQLRG